MGCQGRLADTLGQAMAAGMVALLVLGEPSHI